MLKHCVTLSATFGVYDNIDIFHLWLCLCYETLFRLGMCLLARFVLHRYSSASTV